MNSGAKSGYFLRSLRPNVRLSTIRISSNPTLKNIFRSTGPASVPASQPASAAGLFGTSSEFDAQTGVRVSDRAFGVNQSGAGETG